MRRVLDAVDDDRREEFLGALKAVGLEINVEDLYREG
jgi:hypothetical protein